MRYLSDFGLTSFKRRADTSQRSDTYFQNSNYEKRREEERERCLCLGELNCASHRGFGSESNNSLHQLMLTWAANKWGLGINPVIPHTVSTLLSQRLSEGRNAGGSGLPRLPRWEHLPHVCMCVCVYFCCSAISTVMVLRCTLLRSVLVLLWCLF